MTEPMHLPLCCPAVDHHWPLPRTLPAVVLVSSQFDPKQLADGDFQRCLIDPPASIQRSVAKRQTEYLAGRLCAREAMRRLDGRVQVPLIGEDRIVWASDYPHLDATFPGVVRELEEHLAKLPASAQDKIRGANAARLYGLSV